MIMKLRPLPYQEESNHIVLIKMLFMCKCKKRLHLLVRSLLPRFHLHSLPSQPRPQALGVCHFQYEIREFRKFHTASDEHTKPWKEGTLFPLYSFSIPPSSLPSFSPSILHSCFTHSLLPDCRDTQSAQRPSTPSSYTAPRPFLPARRSESMGLKWVFIS